MKTPIGSVNISGFVQGSGNGKRPKKKNTKQELDLLSYKHFFDHTLDLACFATLEGYFLEVNEAFENCLAFSKEELVTKSFLEFIHQDDLKKTLAEMENLSLGIKTLNFINRYRTRAGSYRHIQWNATYNIETEKIFALGRDITETVNADFELHFQNTEKEKRAAELVIANKELLFQNREKEKRAEEVIIANKELLLHLDEKERGKKKLKLAFLDLKKSEKYLKHYIEGLEVMMYMISHRVRQPIAHLLGIASQLTNAINSPEELKILVDFMKDSALSLDFQTRALTTYMSDLDKKRKENNPF